jgi:hypothetical protein
LLLADRPTTIEHVFVPPSIQALGAARDALRAFAAGLDAGAVPAYEAAEGVKLAAEIKNSAAAVEAALAARVAESGTWEAVGRAVGGGVVGSHHRHHGGASW